MSHLLPVGDGLGNGHRNAVRLFAGGAGARPDADARTEVRLRSRQPQELIPQIVEVMRLAEK